MIDLGTVRPGATIRIPFSSFDKDDGSSITMTNFAVGDILIYKDGDTTARASTSGFTATTDFSSKTGKHLAIIDLADNTTADFYAAGSEYLVAIDSVTVDGVTTGGWIARFRIGYPGAVFDTTIASLSNQTSFTLTTGPAEDDALNDHEVWIHDAASAVQRAAGIIIDYTGSTKTVTLGAAPTFTVAAKDNISVMGPRHGSNNPIPADLRSILGTVLTETAGLIAAGFKKFFNIASPTSTMNQITLVDTATNLTNAPTNGDLTAAMKASVNAEADQALADYAPAVAGNDMGLTAVAIIRTSGCVHVDSDALSNGAGTPNDPCDSIANGKTVADANGVETLILHGATTHTLGATLEGYLLKSFDLGVTLDLNGQHVANEYENLHVTGTAATTNTEHNHFRDCDLEDIAFPDFSHVIGCRPTGTLEIQPGTVVEVAEAISLASPTFQFDAVSATPAQLVLANCFGNYNIDNLNADGARTDVLYIDGGGRFVFQSGCNGGTLRVSGSPIYDTSAATGQPTLTESTIKDAVDAVQADLPQRITKNTALSAFEFTMVDDSDHVTGLTGLTITATRSLDGAAFGACANSASEVGSGVYKIDLAAGDLNGNTVTLKFTATGADARIIHIITQPT